MVAAAAGRARGCALHRGCGGRRVAARLAWPAGRRPRCARVPAAALRPPRPHALGQLLVRRPLRVHRLQRPLLPPRGVPRPGVARGAHGGGCRRRVRPPARAGVGLRRTLGRTLVRAPLAGSDLGRRAPARAGCPVRPPLPARAAGRAALDRGHPHPAHPGLEPGRVRAARRRTRRNRRRPPPASAAPRRRSAGGSRRPRGGGRAAHAAPVPGGHARLPRRRGGAGGRLLHRPARADLAARASPVA